MGERWTMMLTPCGDLRASGFDWCEPLESCCMRDRAQAREIEVVPASHLRGAVEALRRIAAGHAHPSKLAGEALDALPPDDTVYDPPYFERGQ